MITYKTKKRKSEIKDPDLENGYLEEVFIKIYHTWNPDTQEWDTFSQEDDSKVPYGELDPNQYRYLLQESGDLEEYDKAVEGEDTNRVNELLGDMRIDNGWQFAIYHKYNEEQLTQRQEGKANAEALQTIMQDPQGTLKRLEDNENTIRLLTERLDALEKSI